MGSELLDSYLGALQAAWTAPTVDGRAAGCRAAMSELLAAPNRGTLLEDLATAPDPRRHRLLEDPERGFIQMIHAYEAGHSTPPHDHGTGWVVYGVVAGSVDIAEYRPTGSDSLSTAATRTFAPGDAQSYLPGAIHSTDARGSEPAVVLRFLSCDLSKLSRRRYPWSAVDDRSTAPGPTG